MATFEIPDKDLETTIDRSADSFLIYDDSESKLVRTNVTSALGITGDPVGTSDAQTLTNKTIPAYEPVKGADDNYVTNAEKIVIGNTSGINSGDNAVNSNYSSLTQYTDEMAQDAVGGMVDTTLTYTDGTPELKVSNPVTPVATGFTITAGTTPKTLTVALDASVAGTNTGDQVLPTRDSLGLDTDDTVTFANLSGTNTGDQTLPTDATITITDVTTNNSSTSKHGWFPKLPTPAGLFLKDDMTWSAPSGSGDVVGPAGATANNVVLFDGITGKLIKDSGLALSGSNTGDQTAGDFKLDDLAAPDDNTDLNANTTNHGLLLKATAPAAGLINVVGIANGETSYANKALFDANDPTACILGNSAAVGTATVAARRDHQHAMPTLTTMYNLFYPVGCIYTTTVSTNPGTLFGIGTWVAFGAGKVLVGLDSGDADFDTVEETGGAKTHTLATTEIPSHYHNLVRPRQYAAETTSGNSIYGTNAGTVNEITGVTMNAGGGDAHNNMQPYIVVYMFKRTA